MNASPETPSKNGAVAPTQNPAPHPRRILLVEDEPLIRQLYTELLNDPDYEVDTAENGAVAWDALQKKGYELLITDNEMPQVSGVELVKKVRAAHMALAVIMVSGTMPTAELNQHPELHLAATLPKPFNITEFTDMVKKVLGTVDGIANSAQLFRECAMLDKNVSQAEKPIKAPVRNPINPSHRILVVDDDNDTRQFSMDVLVGSGYDVEDAKDGAAGWKALQAGNNYDLVVTDNKMPNMTGIEMIAKLRDAHMTVPIIMATGILPMNEFARQPWLKPDAMLQRPFSNDDLLAMVKKVLRTDDGNKTYAEMPLPPHV
jgi:two-component system, sensor histidine kinase and response regulator